MLPMLREYGGRISLVVSVIFVYIGVLTMSSMGSWESAISFLISAALLLIGLGLEHEWLATGIRTREGVSTLLLSSSVMALAASVILLQFRDLAVVWKVQIPGTNDYLYMPAIVFPYSMVSGILLILGVSIFVAGIILRWRAD